MALNTTQQAFLANCAYPTVISQLATGAYDFAPGISKREMFASMAMQGMLTMFTVNYGVTDPKTLPPATLVATQAKAYADALIAALAAT